MTVFEDRNTLDTVGSQADISSPARTTLTLELADRLLELLSTDDGFRARFVTSPRAALAEMGYQTPEARLGVFGLDPAMPFSHLEGGLASKAALATARARLRQRYESRDPAIFAPFDFCAG